MAREQRRSVKWHRKLRSPLRREVGSALLVGLAATGASALGRFGPYQVALFPPEVLAEALFASIPMTFFQVGVRLFGLYAKSVAFALATLFWLALIGGAMWGAARTILMRVQASRAAVATVAAAMGFPLLWGVHAIATLVPGDRAIQPWASVILPLLVGTAVVAAKAVDRRARRGPSYDG